MSAGDLTIMRGPGTDLLSTETPAGILLPQPIPWDTGSRVALRAVHGARRQRELPSEDTRPFTKPACGPGRPFRPCGGAGIKIT